MEVIWLGGHVNEQIAAYLKNRGIIDDYEANAAYVRLIINKPSVTIAVSYTHLTLPTN